MSKKGLLSSLIVGLFVTLALGVYTIVSICLPAKKPSGPVNNDYVLAYRTGDKVDVFDNYSEEDGTLTITLAEGVEEKDAAIKKNTETGDWEAVAAGELTAVVKLDKKGNTNTYKITVYQQGSGETEAEPYIIAHKAHLIELRDDFNEVTATAPKYIEIVGDIDLGGVNWVPIGYAGHEYDGNIKGNGHTISNLKISVTNDNLADYRVTHKDDDIDHASAMIDLGLFGAIKGNTISDLNIEGAEITVNDAVYETLIGEVAETEEFRDYARLTVGVLAGRADNATIVGGENKNVVSSRINAFSFTSITGYANGVGGLIGVGNLVRIHDYSIKTTVINNIEATKMSNIGGVVGYFRTDTTVDGAAVTAEAKNLVDNVEVAFSGSLLYKNEAYVGGVVGVAYNAEIINTNVTSFRVSDPTARGQIDYTLSTPTLVAGVAANIVTKDAGSDDLTAAFASKIADVNVSGVNVYMLGGDVAGVVGVAAKKNDTLPVEIKDTTVSGTLQGNYVSGFAFQLNPNATVEYTKALDNAAVDVNLTGHFIAGFVVFNFSTVKGFINTVTPEAQEGEEAPAPVTTKTLIKVVATGMGAAPTNDNPENLYYLRNNTYVAGFVAENAKYQNSDIIPEVTDFEVELTATNSVSYAGVAHLVDGAKISGIKVTANVTSFTSEDVNGESFSTTYMVAGVANLVEAGSTIENCEVTLNANKGVDTAKAYAGSYVGGLVSRYLGDEAEAGLTLTGNTVTGEVYFNRTYHEVAFGTGSEEYEYVGIFAAGGLIGAMSSYTSTDPEFSIYYDAVAPIAFAATTIADNKVENFTITADFKKEADELKATEPETHLMNQAYRVRAIGATIGLILTSNEVETANIDLSNGNTVSGVVIRAYEITFTYDYVNSTSGRISNVTLGGNKHYTVGMTYRLNTGVADITDIADFDDANAELVTYEELQ